MIVKKVYIHVDGQLTPPNETVCVGQQVVFTCQQTGVNSRWKVNLPNKTISNSVYASLEGTVSTFINDPGFGFEIHRLPSSSSSSVISELRVIAVEQLDGVTVECIASEMFMTTIQIISVPG